MLTWNQHTDDNNTFRLWPWEDVRINQAEYIRSLQNLARFIEAVDVSELHTIEDLSAVASLIGHDVYTVTMVKGKEIEKQPAQLAPGANDPLCRVEREYVFTKFLRDQEITVTASNGHVCISEKKRSVGFGGYQREELRVKLPAERDIAIGERPNVDEYSIFALDVRGGRMREYFPVREPSNSDIQQGFTRVLKDAVKDIVAVLP